MKVAIMDMSNMLYRTFYASNVADEGTISLAHHKALMSMNKFFRQIKPDMTVAVFDRPNNWRKLYTEHTENRPSPLQYKGHRRQNFTPRQAETHKKFLESIKELEAMLRDQTKIITLACDGLEADDLIAGFVQSHLEHECTVISADNDFLQLLRHPNAKLLDPKTESYKTLEEWNNDPDYFMFLKCCKGDTSDNVMRIFPKVYKAKVKDYYTDELKRVNAFNEAWKFDGTDIIPGDVFKENRLLMDLAAQPEGIRELIEESIAEELSREKSYNQMKFWRFCGKHELKNIAASADSFNRLFTTHP